MEDRINKLENKVNILNNLFMEVKSNVNSIGNKLDMILNKISNNEIDYNKDNNNNISYADKNGSLYNDKNPFIIAKKEIENQNKIESESSINSNLPNLDKKRKKYLPREPLYYYYQINYKSYKYTCTKKTGKFTLPFNCSDTTCNAKGSYNKLTEIFTPNEIAHIDYEKHSYVIPEIIKNKFKNESFVESDFKDNLLLLGNYFKYLFLKDYRLTPVEAKDKFKTKFPNIDLTGNDINTYINTKYREAKNINRDKILNTEKYFKMLDEEGKNISNVIEYIDESDKNEKFKFIIIGKEELLINLKNNNINQFFMDCTYKAVPPNIYNLKLMVISGFDVNLKKTILCAFILLPKENVYTFKQIFLYLAKTYSFNPRKLMVDFNIAQIKAVKEIFPDCKLHTCFFHFSQAIWKNFKKNNLCGKNTYERNSELLFNIQILAFIKRDKIENFYKEIKQNYRNNKFSNFFKYFTRNWMGNRYPKTIWNYYDVLKDEIDAKYFQYTNNISENINRYINSFLNRSKCSNVLFREAILKIINQFNNKVENKSIIEKKSEILKFYIQKNKEECQLLTNKEIDKLLLLYNEVNFNYINKSYIENESGELDNLMLAFESDEEHI